MSVVLQVSDPHFGTERPPVVAALERLAAELRPDLLLLTGDITQRARPIEFSRARAFVDRLKLPAVLTIPGNHDIPLYAVFKRLLDPYGRYKRSFGPALEGDFENDELLVIALNTTRRYRHKHGQVSEAQIEHVERRLAQARPSQCRVIAVHQPVAVTRESDHVNLLRGHERAVRRWSAAGADIVIGGHIHLPYVLPLRQQWPDLPRPMWAVQAGTALSTRVRGGIPNSVNVIRTGPCRIERHDYDEATRAFVQVSEVTLG